MVGRGAPLRALVASLGALAALSLGAAPPAAAGAGAHHAPVAPETAPLSMTIDALSPSALSPAALRGKGEVVVQGSITNESDETWTTIRVYTFIGDDGVPPIRGSRALEDSLDVGADTDVGERITDVGAPGKVELLEPGQSASYTVSVPLSAFHLTRPGVYWFGVHAIGQSDSSPRDLLADGKARTFLPYLPAKAQADPLPTALVLPLQGRILHRADGSLARPERWLRDLSPGGRLDGLIRLAAAAAGRGLPLSLVADPALLDSVARLAHGNPPRSLGTPAADGTGTASPDGEEDEIGGDGDPADPDSVDGLTGIDPDRLPDEVAPLARAAAGWLELLGDAVPTSQVFTLPYGDVDMPAALAYGATSPQRSGRSILKLATAHRSAVLADLGVSPDPALASPNGYLDSATIAASPQNTTVLLTDHALRGAQHGGPGVARVGDRVVVTYSSGFSAGGPGPSSPTAGVALRQRLLAEVAVRLVSRRHEPLVARLPAAWSAQDAAAFLEGLEVPWLDVMSLGSVLGRTSARTLPDDAVRYPATEQLAQVHSATFDAADRLIQRGDRLGALLGDQAVGNAITEQALTSVGYDLRPVQTLAQRSTRASERWVRHRLRAVEIVAPSGVTLSSDHGTFAATLVNNLDQPVTVSVVARSDDGLRVDQPEPVALAPHARTTVLLKAKTTSSRVHNVVLLVADAEGRPVGSRAELPIRSAQVSDVIWIIMGIGAALLFLAIAVRLARRVRAARRGADAHA